jgi:hypothetical protein
MYANRATILALTAAMALAGPPLEAQGARRGGGGHPGAGGNPGRSYAVPRGGAPAHPGYAPRGGVGYAPRGGVAAARHPRAGTGSYYRPGYGGHYPPRYNGHYNGYYGYYGHYRPYWYGSFYVGWPYYYSAGWWPYGYSSPSFSLSYYGYRDEVPAPPPLESNREAGRIRLEVRPEDASVYVDDEFRGNARETKFITLRPGRHSIELVRPGFEVVRREVEVFTGETSDVLVELQRP